MSFSDHWTRDSAGQYVRWNQPPYSDPATGKLCLLLPGEDVAALDLTEHLRRIQEYYLLVWRDAREMRHQNEMGLGATGEKRRGPE